MSLYEAQYLELKKQGKLGFIPSGSLQNFIKETLLTSPMVKLEETSELLEIGCGTGSQLAELIKDKPICAIDCSTTAIRFAESHNQNELVHFKQLDFIADDYSNQMQKKYDLILDAHLLHCLTKKEERNRYFTHIKNSLKKGGVLGLETMIYHGGMSFNIPYQYRDNVLKKGDLPLRYIPRSIELEDEILTHGLKIVYLMVYESLKMIPVADRNEPLPSDPEVVRLLITK